MADNVSVVNVNVRVEKEPRVVTILVCWCGERVIEIPGDWNYLDPEGEISAVCGRHA